MTASTIMFFYAQNDHLWADWIEELLKERLKERGYRVYKIWGNAPGTNEALALEEAFRDVALFVTLFSPEFFDQESFIRGLGTVIKDAEKGSASGKTIPIRIKECEPTGVWKSIVPIDLADYQEEADIRDVLLREFDAIYARIYGIPQPSSQSQKPAFPLDRTSPALQRNRAPASPSPNKPFVNIPYSRNLLHFVERKTLFAQIDEIYSGHRDGSPTVAALCGLPGSGKTRLAVEYAYRHYENRTYQYILWIDASTREKLQEDVKKLLTRLYPGEKGLLQQDTELALKDWLHTHDRWLLIFDDIDEISDIIKRYTPPIGDGHILLTTCLRNPGNINFVTVGDMDENEAVSFLLKRTRAAFPRDLSPPEEQENRTYAREIAQLLHWFPLALEQAGAYIAWYRRGFKSYWQYAQNDPVKFLRDRGLPDDYHPATIVEDWKQAFEELAKFDILAAELLLFCVFFHPYTPQEEIFVEIFTKGKAILGPSAQEMDSDFPLDALDKAVIALNRYSFISKSMNGLFTVHPLMKVILPGILDAHMKQLWPERIIVVVRHIWAEQSETLLYEYKIWLPCIKACLDIIAAYKLNPSGQKHLLELEQRMLDMKRQNDEKGCL